MEEIQSRQEDMRRRLDARCKGLLEVIHDSSSHNLKVDFLHRTVRDFLATKDMQVMLTERIQMSSALKCPYARHFLRI
jgi:hypothetical protein